MAAHASAGFALCEVAPSWNSSSKAATVNETRPFFQFELLQRTQQSAFKDRIGARTHGIPL